MPRTRADVVAGHRAMMEAAGRRPAHHIDRHLCGVLAETGWQIAMPPRHIAAGRIDLHRDVVHADRAKCSGLMRQQTVKPPPVRIPPHDHVMDRDREPDRQTRRRSRTIPPRRPSASDRRVHLQRCRGRTRNDALAQAFWRSVALPVQLRGRSIGASRVAYCGRVVDIPACRRGSGLRGARLLVQRATPCVRTIRQPGVPARVDVAR